MQSERNLNGSSGRAQPDLVPVLVPGQPADDAVDHARVRNLRPLRHQFALDVTPAAGPDLYHAALRLVSDVERRGHHGV